MSFTKVTRATEDINTGFGRFNTLIDDLASTSNAKGASQIGIEDTAGNMAATDVEAALAEIYTDTSSTRTLAELFDENSATTTGLTWGSKAGVFRVDNTVTSVSAGTIGLTDDATNYVEVDPSDGLVKKNTTAFTTARIPLRQIVTASGSQSTSTDKRAWFSNPATATTSVVGIVELATDAETIAGTATDKVCTPSNIEAALPSGVIVMWSGAISAIPTGWVICDGNNGTPNLTDRFVIHADADSGGTNDVGDTGGSNTIAEAQLPSHTHSDGTLSAESDSHNHGVGTLATDDPGDHTHTYSSRDGGGYGYPEGTAGPGSYKDTSSSGAHTHTISGSSASTGSGNDYKPKYYALAYIQKV